VRVIEPNNLKRRSIKKKKRSFLPFFIAIACLGVAGYVAWQLVVPEKIDTQQPKANQVTVQTQQAAAVEPVTQKTKLKNFSNQQFVDFYNNFAYPNNTEIVTPPVITGNAEADKRIQKLAEARGYKLRSAPVSPPVATLQSYLIQQKAQQPLIDLFDAAKKQGYTLTLTAAFRSVEEQRDLFLGRLAVPYADIAAGKADDSVNQTLKVTAPPGYSRHHNGFTIDIACGDIGGLALLETPCYAWLSKDNFKNAKEFGWIPSYPDGATSVGPEPEPWELVWVGRDALLE
jgi:D-alanyl-D-alanine carboxypeptidase